MRGDKNTAEIQSGVQERKDSTKIALVSCSNGMTESFRPSFLRLLSIFEEADWNRCTEITCLQGGEPGRTERQKAGGRADEILLRSVGGRCV